MQSVHAVSWVSNEKCVCVLLKMIMCMVGWLVPPLAMVDELLSVTIVAMVGLKGCSPLPLRGPRLASCALAAADGCTHAPPPLALSKTLKASADTKAIAASTLLWLTVTAGTVAVAVAQTQRYQ